MSIDFLTTKLRFLGKIFSDVSLNIPDLNALKMLILVFFCVINAKNRDKTSKSGYIPAKNKAVVLASLQNQKIDRRLNLKKSKRLGEVGAK